MADWIKRWLASPAVDALMQRFAAQFDFIRARLSRSSDLGLRLTLSVFVFIGASWLFAGVAEDIVTGDPLVELDLKILRWLQQHATPGVLQGMQLVSDAHGPWPISALGLVFALYLACKRAWTWLGTLMLVLPVGMLFNLVLKQIFHRGRPVLDEPLLALASYSFPSGHVTATTLFYGVLAAFLATHTSRLGRRAGLYVTAAFMVLLVGATRIYLGAHYFSDVIAAAAWSTAWLVLCLMIKEAQARRRSAQRSRLA